MDGLDDLDAEVAKKKRTTNRRGEITPSPRHPKPTEPAGQEKQAQSKAGTQASAHTGVPVHTRTDTQEVPVPPTSDPAKRRRPPSIEAYLTEDLMDWMWKVRAAGMADRRENVSSAVVRLALEQLREQMTPKQIIRALDEVPAPQANRKGRRGRAR